MYLYSLRLYTPRLFYGKKTAYQKLGQNWQFVTAENTWPKLTETVLGDKFYEQVAHARDGITTIAGEAGKEMCSICTVAAIVGLKAAGFQVSTKITFIASRVQIYCSAIMGATTINTEAFIKLLLLPEVHILKDAASLSPKSAELPATAFAFEDVEHVLGGDVSARLMKDSELQSYNLNGEIIYDKWWWADYPFCKDLEVPVKNDEDIITGYLNMGPTNFPCLEEAYTVTPITGTTFYRNVVDAPPVPGSYGGDVASSVEAAIRENYPSTAYYADQALEDYVDMHGNYITSFGYQGSNHTISDAGPFEPYQYVNWHETSAGNPWVIGTSACPGYAKGYCSTIGLCSTDGYNSLPQYGSEYSCNTEGGICSNSTYTTASSCGGAGHTWTPAFWTAYDTKPKCEFLGHTWTDTIGYASPNAPPAFPGSVDDVSLRHHKFYEGVGTSIPYWDQLSQIKHTGFALIPLEFSTARLLQLYGTSAVNPVIDLRNLGRRAFSFESPTSEVVDHTVGPPQPFASRYNFHPWLHLKGGPFLNAQVYFENKTMHRKAKIALFPGWSYRYRENCDPYQTWHFNRTGGWNMPLSWEYEQRGWESPISVQSLGDGNVRVPFVSSRISNNFNPDNLYGNSMRPYVYDLGSADIYKSIDGHDLTKYHPSGDPSSPWSLGPEVYTPQMFFGMGDSSQDFPIIQEWRTNAGFPYTHATFNLTGDDFPHKDDQDLKDWLKVNGVRQFYESTILGCYGDREREGGAYWNKYITGWIFTGSAHAGEVVSAMHLHTGFSTESNKRVYYHWLQPDLPEYFPFSGSACAGWGLGAGVLSPYPNISKCAQLFPNYYGCNTTTSTPAPVVATTVDPLATTTTCDPMDPECDDGMNPPTTTSTSTTPDPPFFIDCCDGEGEVETWAYDCEMLNCCDSSWVDPLITQPWDVGVSPEDWGWSKLYTKTRTENPPRYWRGPFASTNFTFLYPSASGALLQDHWSEHTPISGFPMKVNFDVEVEEWIAKDFESGGYINCEGEVVWDERIKGKDGNYVPHYKDSSEFGNGLSGIFIPWSDMVNSGYIDEQFVLTQSHSSPSSMGSCTLIRNDNTHTRNIERYTGELRFDGGNQILPTTWYGYATEEEYDDTSLVIPCDDWFHNAGGFYMHTGYEFPIEATYARPTFSLKTVAEDYSEMINALRWGNQIAYDCGYWLPRIGGFDEYGEALSADPLPMSDPVYFEPMASSSHQTGRYALDPLNWNLEGEQWYEGSLIHRRRIYGDAWFGLKSGCLFVGDGVAGNWDSPIGMSPLGITTTTTCDPADSSCTTTTYTTPAPTTTTSCPWPPHPCVKEQEAYFEEMENMMAESEKMGACSAANATSTELNIATDQKVFLFSIRPDEVNIDIRNPVFVTGYQLTGDAFYGIGISEGNYGKGFGFSLSGTNLQLRVLTQEEVEQDVDPLYGGASNRPIEFFKPGKMENGITFEAPIIERRGTLYHVPTGSIDFQYAPLSPGATTTTSTTCDPEDPSCMGSMWGDTNNRETILEVGKRLCIEANPPVTTTTPAPIDYGVHENNECRYGRIIISGIVPPWGDAPCPTCPNQTQNTVGGNPAGGLINANGVYYSEYEEGWIPTNLVNGKQKYLGPQANSLGRWTWIEWSSDNNRWELWSVLNSVQPVAYSNSANDCPWDVEWTQQIDYNFTTDTYYWGPHGTSTLEEGTDTPHPPPIPLTTIRASGWKEQSKLRIKIKNIRIHEYSQIPFDVSHETQISGNCRVTGVLEYKRQEEASIYTEGFSLMDVSNDPDLDSLDYPNYSSDVLKRPGIDHPTGIMNFGPEELGRPHVCLSAPSRMQTRGDEHNICEETISKKDYMKGGKHWDASTDRPTEIYRGQGCMMDLNRGKPENYNKYAWPTVSDMAHFNGNGGGLSWESLPRNDGHTYPNSNLLISAAQGQPTTDTVDSQVIDRHYLVVQHKGLYDSLFVDPTAEGMRQHWMVDFPIGWEFHPKGGYMVPLGTTVRDLQAGSTNFAKHGTKTVDYS
ncbi:MAG TPA: hypothetical protein EYN27_09960 [Rhodospirillales bacterium]|nr:hypothetical protein [Rhodospirillales bacterium]